VSVPADAAVRGAPPTSARALALLFTPQAQRETLTALFAIDAQWRAVAAGHEHAIAHVQLDWWASELARLRDGEPRHPLTRALLGAAPLTAAVHARLAQRLLAARESLAALVPADLPEFEAQLERSHGSVVALTALLLDAPECTQAALELGLALGYLERAQSLPSEARRPRLPPDLPGGQSASGLSPSMLAAAQRALGATAGAFLARASASLARVASARSRPLLVLAALASDDLERWSARGEPPGAARGWLAPLRSLLVAWRAARRAVPHSERKAPP
jgi:15-cis-phytoene synthase